MLASAEHQVLEQVRKSGLAQLLVFRADVIPRVNRHDRRLVVLVHDHRQAVAQHEFLKWNIDVDALRARSSRKECSKQNHNVVLIRIFPPENVRPPIQEFPSL